MSSPDIARGPAPIGAVEGENVSSTLAMRADFTGGKPIPIGAVRGSSSKGGLESVGKPRVGGLGEMALVWTCEKMGDCEGKAGRRPGAKDCCGVRAGNEAVVGIGCGKNG